MGNRRRSQQTVNKAHRERLAAMAAHPSNRKPTDWSQAAYNPALGMRCQAVTIRDPEDADWSPEQPDTQVRAECALAQVHRGWHVSADGYSWDPEDDAMHVQFPRPA